MAQKKFTFLEVHLDGSDLQFGPSSVGDVPGLESGESDDEGSVEVDVEAAEESADCNRGIALLVGLALLVVIAVVARKVTGGDDIEELEELDDFA
ncbi:MAG: hypothetical protein ACQETI_05920 [Halobacteriota archaeon]